jgi:hypothetical protein
MLYSRYWCTELVSIEVLCIGRQCNHVSQNKHKKRHLNGDCIFKCKCGVEGSVPAYHSTGCVTHCLRNAVFINNI